MCCFCHCCAWSFDLIQRFLTFILTCCLCAAICFGLTLALVVGIAYGYHYSMAEFLTFTRSDVTVYMRRGQFYDKPELNFIARRKGDLDLFASNASTDYEDTKIIESDAKPLADTWVKAQDTRNYAERLTKYGSRNVIRKYNLESNKTRVHPVYQDIAMEPLTLAPYTTIEAIASQRTPEDYKMIKFRHYDPGQKETQFIYDAPAVDSTVDPETEEHLIYRATKPPNSNKIHPWRSTVIMGRDTSNDPESSDYENIMYKPV